MITAFIATVAVQTVVVAVLIWCLRDAHKRLTQYCDRLESAIHRTHELQQASQPEPSKTEQNCATVQHLALAPHCDGADPEHVHLVNS